MLAGGLITEEELEVMDGQAGAKIDEAVTFASESPYPLPEEALQDLWVEDGTPQ